MTLYSMFGLFLICVFGYIVGKVIEAIISDYKQYKAISLCYGRIYETVPPWSPYCGEQPIMQIRRKSSEARQPIQKTKENVIMKTKIKEALVEVVLKRLAKTRREWCVGCRYETCEGCGLNKSMSDLVKEAILFDGDVEITVKAKGIGVLARSEE